MNIEKHLERLKESLEVIEESVTKDIVKRQRNIGFNTSAAAVDMLEMFLHQNKLIQSGFLLKHEWFKAKNKLEEKLPFDFMNKLEILELMYFIETNRDPLCYGVPKDEIAVRQVLLKFDELKKMFVRLGVKIE